MHNLCAHVLDERIYSQLTIFTLQNNVRPVRARSYVHVIDVFLHSSSIELKHFLIETEKLIDLKIFRPLHSWVEITQKKYLLTQTLLFHSRFSNFSVFVYKNVKHVGSKQLSIQH